MDELLNRIFRATGISGYEKEIASIMQEEFKKTCDEVWQDDFGNCIARKGSGNKKIMLAAHMDEIGLLIKQVTNEGYLNFIKVGGIDDRVLPGQRVIIKNKKGEFLGIIGAKPPHLQKEEERKQVIKYEDMFIDIGARSKEEALEKVSVADQAVFEAGCGSIGKDLIYGKAVDNRAGCYALLKIMEKLGKDAEVYAVATAQEEVGLKGARVASFKINPDFAIALDTTVAGDTPQIKERESILKLGEGVAITIMEASGRGIIVNERIKDLFIETAKINNIKYQIDIIEGGMTDGAIICLNREGISTGVLSIPARYLHSPTGVFSMNDLNAMVELTLKVIEKVK